MLAGLSDCSTVRSRCSFSQQTRFQTMSNAIIGRIDEMGGRIDDLEKSIGELMAQAGIEEEADKAAAPKQIAAPQ